MSGYRIEVSPNNRAGCQDTVCKANGDKILKGMLRFGTWVEIMGHGSWRWKHWGCVSGAQLKSVREASAKGDSYDWDAIDGYDEMGEHPDLQEKIRTAVEEGHIAPEDFNGDPEFNVLGQRAIRSRSAVKAGKDGEDPAEAEAKGTTPKKTPAKKTPAKRGRKAANDDEEADETPTTKRAKTAAAKAEPAAAPRPRGRPRKSAVKAEPEEEEEEEEAPAAAAPRGRGRPRKSAVKPEPESDAEEEEAAPAPAPRGRGRPRKSVNDAADVAEAEKKPKKGGRKSKGSA